ncbi:hypothetical protein O181_007590 [Austropuccinia psidii MF-1]|uniref:Reverse transcriptase RNase H-like domain-containing protein n=1 Tax=Austropuccinia psidii MF-1 TaxID=1389203 RepID=A0A9Q3GI16_9BASI|nr:hypothetical protein [Austropuccinia psidii MF-1]
MPIPEELNYEIHDNKLLGIVWALKCLRYFLLFVSSHFEVLTNHSLLQYCINSKVVTFWQALWDELVFRFHFSIPYCPGWLANLPDALSCWDDIYPEREEDFLRKNPLNLQKLNKQDEVQTSRLFAVKVESFSNLINSIQKELWKDPQYRGTLQDLRKGKSVTYYSLDPSPQLLLFKDWFVVPNASKIQLRVLLNRQESPVVGHTGHEKSLRLSRRSSNCPT